MTDTGYRMQHQPDPDGAPLHDIESVMPDYYAHPEYYSTGDDECDGQSRRAILRNRNRPDAMVWIYRAVPRHVYEAEGPSVLPGDWVSTSKAYARQHGMHATDPAQDLPVATRRVPARTLRQDGNSINEWGYFP
jgi:hypothetical protein